MITRGIATVLIPAADLGGPKANPPPLAGSLRAAPVVKNCRLTSPNRYIGLCLKQRLLQPNWPYMSLDETRSLAPGAEPPVRMLAECPDCDKPLIALSRGFVVDTSQLDPDIDDPTDYAGPIYRFTLLECEKNHAIVVRQIDTWEDPFSFNWDGPVRVYPARERQLSSLIPDQLRQIHDEARTCLAARAYTAAAVMAGRTLEATCSLNGIKARGLHQALSKMKEIGLIDGRLWEWADTLRTVRNSAAHFDGNTVSKQDATDALAFNEALLDYLYVLTARFNALKERRARSKPEGVSPKNPG
jgi:hypothetical protein